METQNKHLLLAAKILEELGARGLEVILVGGMALVVMGSRRVTMDFDFLLTVQEEKLDHIVTVFYQHGFELVSKLNENGDVLRTIDNKNIAKIRLKLDKPDSAFFFNHKSELKIDLLFDFPFPAQEVAKNSLPFKIGKHTIHIASVDDLIRMKEIAYADRKVSTDAQDLEFLRKLKK